jgi:hypothetical protein
MGGQYLPGCPYKSDRKGTVQYFDIIEDPVMLVRSVLKKFEDSRRARGSF